MWLSGRNGLRVFLSEPHHGHLEFDHEELDLTLLDELCQSLQYAIFFELLGGEEEALGSQVANSTVEDLQGEQLLNKGVVLQERVLKSGKHVVLVHEASLTRKVFVDDGKDGKDVATATGALKELIVDPKDSDEELAREWEVELGVFSNELSNQRKRVQHAELDVLVMGIILSR